MHNYMQIALEEALKTKKDIPVGAVIVKNGEIIAAAHNTKEIDNDITSHAEILAIRQASEKLKNWRLEDCDIYVTLEPCPMCGWAIIQSRIKNLYFGSFDKKYGAFSSECDLRKITKEKINVYSGIMEKKCDTVLKDFFNNIRSNN